MLCSPRVVLSISARQHEGGECCVFSQPVREIDGEALRITNFVQEAAMFEAAGVGAGFTRMNAVSIFLGMRKLANKEPVKSVRIFGKVSTRDD